MSNRPMRTSRRLIGLVAIACAAVAFSATPAGAVIASPESSSYVFIGNKWKAQHDTICGRDFAYVQRMTIDGVSTMVPTEFIYTPGRHALVLQETCDGHNIYRVGSAGV
jgi:hypothetical protein